MSDCRAGRETIDSEGCSRYSGGTMRRLDRLRTPRAALVAHLVVLGVGVVALLVVASREWFFYDDWYYLISAPGRLWAPHVGHWDTIPVLVFIAIQQVFGMDSYLPYAVPAILAHLGAVHLIWRISRRAGVRPWIATAFSVLLTFLGAGAEAIDWAVQIGYVGGLTAMLGAIVLLDRPRLRLPVGVAAAALMLAGVMCSGVALPFALAAAVIAWRRHGLLRAIAVVALPGLAWLTWFVLIGRTASTADRAVGTQILQVPQYAVEMLSDGVGRMFPIVVLGGLVFTALGTWWLVTLRRVPSRAIAAYVLFPVAPVFAVLTGFSRWGLGLETASSSRYVYVVVLSIAPLMALALSRFSTRAGTAPLAALVLLVALWNAGGLSIALLERIHRADTTRAELAATAVALRADPGCFANDVRPSPQWAPDVTVGALRAWLDAGWYHPVRVEPAACP
jgi:hypothetical protein